MATEKRLIGLSLGADICWPIAFEQIVSELKLDVPHEGARVGVEVERITIEPFDLRQGCRYDVVLDRLTHWFDTSREWIKKAVIMDDLYVFNNPWSVQSMEKQTSYCAMMKLGMKIPDTWLVPPKEHEARDDLQPTLERYARFFDLGDVGHKVGYPHYMKPYDGGGWVGVSRIENDDALKAAYEQSGKHVMHLQRSVEGHDLFCRCIGVGPQTRIVKYDPGAPLHDRYTMETGIVSQEDALSLRNTTLTINSFFGWDFNSCEALRLNGEWFPIDFANPCPDSQVTSLHYHFPWLVIAKIRWALFCAITNKKMNTNLNWAPYNEIAASERTYEEKLTAYAKIADERMETARFDEFCHKHLGNLDEIAWNFFGSETAKNAVRRKVEALFPEHEHEEFTELFFNRIQTWRSAVHQG